MITNIIERSWFTSNSYRSGPFFSSLPTKPHKPNKLFCFLLGYLATIFNLACLIDQVNHKAGNDLSDQYLVKKVLSGDTNSFSAIIKGTEGLVAQIVFRMISNTEDRKDIAQDVYLKAFNRLNSFKFQSKLSTWIGQIAYNSCINYLEKKKLVLAGTRPQDRGRAREGLEALLDNRSDPFNTDTERLIAKKELSGILRSEMENLTPIFKTLITLYHQEDQSYEEIAQITELPVGTVKSYLYRARKTLKLNILAKYKIEDL
jgi:RNA polymerase sigma factor (sigma-70 family)